MPLSTAQEAVFRGDQENTQGPSAVDRPVSTREEKLSVPSPGARRMRGWSALGAEERATWKEAGYPSRRELAAGQTHPVHTWKAI